VNVDVFAQQIHVLHRRLDDLYRGASVKLDEELLPVAFKELGVVSEELQVAVEELQLQNQELTAVRSMLVLERQRYQELFDLAPDGYIVSDAAGTIQEANSAAAKMLKVSQQFLTGKPLVIFVHEDERQVFHSQLTYLRQAENTQELLVTLTPRKGEPFQAGLKIAKVCDCQGAVVGLRICIREAASGYKKKAGLEKNCNDLTAGHSIAADLPRHIYSVFQTSEVQ